MLARKTEFQGNIEAMGVNSHHPKILPSIFAYCGGFDNVLKRPKKCWRGAGKAKKTISKDCGSGGEANWENTKRKNIRKDFKTFHHKTRVTRDDA